MGTKDPNVAVFNLSQHNLTKPESSVLSKSLKFVPDPKQGNAVQRKVDIRRFANKVRNYEHFSKAEKEEEIVDTEVCDEIESGPSRPLFKNPSRWQPPQSKDKTLTAILDNLITENEHLLAKETSRKTNVSNSQRFAINQLKMNNEIVIKTADKGGATVIINKADYHDAMQEMLSDTTTYQKIDKSNPEDVMKKVKEFVKTHISYLSKVEADYITNHDTQTAYIYGLPKIHKCKKLKEELKNEQNTANGIFSFDFKQLKIPFRPIVSGTKCPLKRLCKLAKILLQPLERTIEHLVIDTFDFLRKVPKEVDGDQTLVAVDIVQLYPSIDHELGLKAVKYWCRKFPEKIIPGFEEDLIIELLKFINDNVFMTFNDDTYKQVQGTAMGKDHAPPYANLVIAYLVETCLYPNLNEQFGDEAMSHIKENLKLYLDDGFTILDENIVSADLLLANLNKMDTRIQFTMETSKCEIPFLDVLIKLTPDIYNASKRRLEFDIYHKPTDAYNYFNFESCAPGHIPRNVPYNLARRIAAIVSNSKMRDLRLQELGPKLKNKGYPQHLVEDAIKKAKTLNREELLTTRKKKIDDKKTLTMVIDHDPNLVDPSSTVKRICNSLLMTEKAKAGIMTMPKIITARRQPPNLSRILSLSKKRDHTLNSNIKPGSYTPCKDSRCGTCPAVIKNRTLTTRNGTVLTRNADMNCKTRDLIYVVICKTCKKEYIGETGIETNRRMNLHRNQITNPDYRNLKVSQHIHVCGKDEFEIYPFLKCYKNCNIYREEMELHIRNKVHPELH